MEENYTRSKELFAKSCTQNGIDYCPDWYFYHVVDLGNGIMTPGVFDYQTQIGLYQFPEDMTGLNVLDVGAATGFFSFHLARKGAHVLAVDLPSLNELDAFPGQTKAHILEKFNKNLELAAPGSAFTLDDAYRLVVTEPFDFCNKILGLNLERVFCNVYDLDVAKLPHETFDWVFVGDILLHTIDPLKALSKVAARCSNKLVIAQYMPDFTNFEAQPLLLYTGGSHPEEDISAWYRPNTEWFMQVLKKLGFSKVEVVGHFTDTHIPTGNHEAKTILHATR